MLTTNLATRLDTSFDVSASPARPANALGARLDRVVTYGFAPDLEHGDRPLGDIYDYMDPDALEATAFVSSLDLGHGARLLTLARWNEGFFELAQLIDRPDAPARDLCAALQLLQGATQILGLTAADHARLQLFLLTAGALDLAEQLHRCAHLPIARDRDDLLARERDDLSLSREDLTSHDALAATFADACAHGDLNDLNRLWEAGRADMLTATSLLTLRAA
jgi:hypothetical protein